MNLMHSAQDSVPVSILLSYTDNNGTSLSVMKFTIQASQFMLQFGSQHILNILMEKLFCFISV